MREPSVLVSSRIRTLTRWRTATRSPDRGSVNSSSAGRRCDERVEGCVHQLAKCPPVLWLVPPVPGGEEYGDGRPGADKSNVLVGSAGYEIAVSDQAVYGFAGRRTWLPSEATCSEGLGGQLAN